VTSSSSSSRAARRNFTFISVTTQMKPCVSFSSIWSMPRARKSSLRARSKKFRYREWYTTPPASVSSQYTRTGQLNTPDCLSDIVINVPTRETGYSSPNKSAAPLPAISSPKWR